MTNYIIGRSRHCTNYMKGITRRKKVFDTYLRLFVGLSLCVDSTEMVIPKVILVSLDKVGRIWKWTAPLKIFSIR